MKFQPNNSLGGRKKGSKNKVNLKVKQAFELLLNNNLETMQKDLNQLDPKDRLAFILQISNYIIPKLKAVEIEDITQDKNNNVLELSVKEVNHIAKALNEKY